MQSEIFTTTKEKVKQRIVGELVSQYSFLDKVDVVVSDEYLNSLFGQDKIRQMAIEEFIGQGRRAPDKITNMELSIIDDLIQVRITYR